MEPGVRFDHQVDHPIASGYPGSCEMTPLAFRQRLAPLRTTIEHLPLAAWEPDLAITRIRGHGRSPLTIEEGVAVVTHHPDLLRSRNCFSILGSRCGDRRVPRCG